MLEKSKYKSRYAAITSKLSKTIKSNKRTTSYFPNLSKLDTIQESLRLPRYIFSLSTRLTFVNADTRSCAPAIEPGEVLPVDVRVLVTSRWCTCLMTSSTTLATPSGLSATDSS